MTETMAKVTPTYYRHRNDDDFKHELVVHAWVPGEGDRWSLTVTADIGFEPWAEIRMRTPGFAAYREFGAFFAQLAARKPTTLDEVAAILDELGAVDETAKRARQREQTAQLMDAEFDTWREPWEEQRDEEPLPPEPHPGDEDTALDPVQFTPESYGTAGEQAGPEGGR